MLPGKIQSRFNALFWAQPTRWCTVCCCAVCTAVHSVQVHPPLTCCCVALIHYIRSIYAAVLSKMVSNTRAVRLIIVRSGSELQIFFDLEKGSVSLYSLILQNRRDEIWVENPMAQVVRFWAKCDDSTHRILKSKNSLGLQSSDNLTEQSRPGTAAVY